jgi:hypothetical protein
LLLGDGRVLCEEPESWRTWRALKESLALGDGSKAVVVVNVPVFESNDGISKVSAIVELELRLLVLVLHHRLQ